MINTDTVMRLTHRALFGKESCIIFVGIKMSGALLQVCAATSLEAALWSAIPWVGSLFVDVVWYAAPMLLKKIVQVMPLEEVRLRELAISVMVRLRLRFSIA